MKRNPPAEEIQEVPGWVVSFGDMITNLLACFVLMQSLASAQEESLFNAGIGSFKRAVKSYGLASHLKNRAREEIFDYRKIKYPTEESSDQALQRVINPRDDQIRQLYDDMRKLLNTSAQDARRRVVVARPVSARFASGSSAIDDNLRLHLGNLAADLKQTLSDQSIIYVMSAAPDVAKGPGQWVLSAQRAHEVRQYLLSTLGGAGAKGPELRTVGVGDGGRWYGNMGLIDQQPHVLIVVLEEY